MTEPTRTLIPIERLTAGHEVETPGFGHAEVYEVEWDRDAYHVTYCTDDRLGRDALDSIRVDAGGTLEYAYPNQEPRYWRDRASITDDEWEALAAAQSQSNTALVAAE